MAGSSGFLLATSSEFHQIGSDQGLLAAPLPIKRLLLAPAERGDVIFDFSAHAGQEVLLKSDTFDLLQFRVSATPADSKDGDSSALPQGCARAAHPGKRRPSRRGG